ncbi:GNAT family N-acetyltransferase [Streptomyces sp. NPDC088400]|uniref:GNAT family N-acetyltransferase n=1 Tax=Streptomyces sp. NPDC088400 TaxID=3365861 RepID=UPI003818611C
MPTPHTTLPIRRLTMADVASCADLAEDRGWAREEPRWRFLLAAGAGYGITEPEGEGLAATCVVSSYGPLHEPSYGPAGSTSSTGDDRPGPPRGRGLVAVGMLLVAGRHARQGLGRRLMTHVLHEAGDTPLALYATSYGRPLYQQLGFTDAGGVERVRGHFRSPDRAPRVTTRPATAQDLPALVRLDAEVLGVDRTHMIARLPSSTDRIRVAEEGSTITGFAAAWSTPEAEAVGPLIARDTETAKALLSSLATCSDRPTRVDIDTRHKELLNWVKEHGLETNVLTTVMVHGIPDLPGDRTRSFAPLSLATG